MKRVLIVEDDAQVLLVMTKVVEGMDLVPIQAASVVAGIQQVGLHVDLILLDLQLPNGHGFEVLRAIADRRDDIPVVVVSGHKEDKTHKAPVPILSWLEKPFEIHELRDAIERGCRFSSSMDQIRRSTDRLERSSDGTACV